MEQKRDAAQLGYARGIETKLESAIQSAINQHGEQLAKLQGLVLSLRDRLNPLLNDSQDVTGKEEVPEPVVSKVRGQIYSQTNTVKGIQSEINLLLIQLEI